MCYREKDIIKQLPCHNFDIQEDQKLYIKENQEIKENETYVAFFSRNETEFKTNVDIPYKNSRFGNNGLKLLEINIFTLKKLQDIFKNRENEIIFYKSISVFVAYPIKNDTKDSNILSNISSDTFIEQAFIDNKTSEITKDVKPITNVNKNKSVFKKQVFTPEIELDPDEKQENNIPEIED